MRAVTLKRAKVAVKGALIGGYCRRLIPCWFVTSAFRVMRLGGV